MDKNPEVIASKQREDFKLYRSIDYSGFFERLFARGFDFLIVIAVFYFTYKSKGLVIGVAAALCFDLISRIILTYFLGGTLGKLFFGIRVVSRLSGKLSIWQVLIRETFKYFSGLFLNFGYISIMTSVRKRAWHDIMACSAVTSGGRQEAKYARDVYRERPQKWYLAIPAVITVIFIVGLLFALNKGAIYILENRGMIGFLKVIESPSVEYKYKLSKTSGLAGINKNIIQLGDVDGDGGYEVFREGIKDDKTIIKSIRMTYSKTLEGDLEVVFDKPIIQYRLLDINGDKKDELAVLFQDKTLKLYKLDGEIVEIGSFGPIEYKEIISVIKVKSSNGVTASKGTPASDGTSTSNPTLYKLYILGDNNKITVLSMKDGKIESQKYDLPGGYNLVQLDSGVFKDSNYLLAASDSGKLAFYSYEDKSYQKVKEMTIPIKGPIMMNVKDINVDGKNEVVISSPESKERPYPILLAYDVSEDEMKLVWDGGKYYKNNNIKRTITMDDGMDIDGDKKFEAYMVSRKELSQEGDIQLIIFEGNKYLLKANDLLRILSMDKPN